MLMSFRTVTLSRTFFDENEVVLVTSVDWSGLRAESEYHEIDAREAMWMLGALDRARLDDLRIFVAQARLGAFPLCQMDDHDVLRVVRESLRDGSLVAVQKGKATAEVPGTVELRRLVAQVEASGKLSYRGRQYKLVAADDLARLPGRNQYEVASQADARVVLDGMAKESPRSAELLRKASGKISRDWHSPSSGPDGLVLLRRIPVQASISKDNGPAITPSQMKALMDKSMLEIHVVDLAGAPQAGLAYSIVMPDGGTAEGELDEDGRASAKSSTPGTFTVSFPGLDGADWDGDGALDLPEQKRSEASRYKVKQGERLPTIARKNGFARWQTIWDFGGNAALKDLRDGGHVLLPGDEVSIPTKLSRVAEVRAGKAEYVVSRAPDWCLRLQLHADDYRCCPDVPYVLTLPSGTEVKGQTDAKGWLNCTLFADLTKCDIRYWPEGTDKPPVAAEVFLKEGQEDSDEDFMNHLRNLGFANDDDSLASMVCRYQRYMDMSSTGQLDDQTKASIRKAIDEADDSLHQELGDDE